MGQDFGQQLSKQLSFLRRSCESYDAGYQDESVRIATCIRVLIHDTKSSTSLLKHLGALNISLASTARNSDRSKTVILSALGRMQFTSTGATWAPTLDPDSIKCWLTIRDWWNQIVYISGTARLSRRDLVLSAADKDGGAHVDAKLNADYESLMNSNGFGFFSLSQTGELGTFTPIIDAHLVYLRQMGHELLSSPELLELGK